MSKRIQIMGIVNLTDDSFFSGSRCLTEDGGFDSQAFQERLSKMVGEGVDILDFGACSTRPGSRSVGEDEEWERLRMGLEVASESFRDIPFSIDTFRPEIVRKAYGSFGRFIVNDVSGGCEEMWSLVGELGLPYVAMHTRGTPENMQSLTDYEDVTAEVVRFFEEIARTADRHGVKDWILDPGFGFAKTVGQNWKLLREMAVFKQFGKKILAGLSRKSFMYKPLGITPSEALPATQMANLVALQNGADILRVHDVAAAAETVRIFELLES